MKILLDYFFPISSISPTPQASTAFLKQALVVVAPKSGVTPGTITLCTSSSAIAALTDNIEAQQLLNAGMSRVYILPASSLDLDTILAAGGSQFFTILISSDFTDANVTAMDLGAWKGVVGVSSTDDAFLATQAAIENRVAFHATSTNKAKNMMYAFGKLLSNAVNWTNQQYITMPFADDVDELGEANALFDDKISFSLSDDEFGQRLGLFAAGGAAIVAPYIKRNLEIDLQSKALSYISGNQPQYTLTQATLLEDELQKVIDGDASTPGYVGKGWLTGGKVDIKLEQENFVASGYIEIPAPTAMWRIFGQITQTT